MAHWEAAKYASPKDIVLATISEMTERDDVPPTLSSNTSVDGTGTEAGIRPMAVSEVPQLLEDGLFGRMYNPVLG